ncbi:hypothetical protein PoB_002493500 [Plakobranchus ocellatus]|uniref:Uncharacterized protein n=1 Tax=Plakobranchus ocellatus TaxID=259542 RepID=A0AAV3ZTJ1_9GAST|nr:hypothetical protein PoB_002493500 [Plakobranchus ocellatus]
MLICVSELTDCHSTHPLTRFSSQSAPCARNLDCTLSLVPFSAIAVGNTAAVKKNLVPNDCQTDRHSRAKTEDIRIINLDRPFFLAWRRQGFRCRIDFRKVRGVQSVTVAPDLLLHGRKTNGHEQHLR